MNRMRILGPGQAIGRVTVSAAPPVSLARGSQRRDALDGLRMGAFRGRGGRGRRGVKKVQESGAGGSGTGRRPPRSSKGRKDSSSSQKNKSQKKKKKGESQGFTRADTVDDVSLDDASEDESNDDGDVYEDIYDSEVTMTVENVLKGFAFPLDPFQEEAFRHIVCGRSVVVCAPTGAGKTAIAEAAATYFLEQGGKVIYTTPLKALSNQKLMEMRDRFGVDDAGLQTGDASINPDGRIVVMTTEILRNMLYRVEEEEEEEEDDDGVSVEQRIARKTNQSQNRLDGVKLVVFDECHYLGDPGRGSVWEESIINLPPDVLVLAMSATVRNPYDISGWISEVHGTCATIVTKFRPVPLQWHFCLSPGDGEVTMLPLLDSNDAGLNPRLIPPSSRVESLAGSLSSWQSDDDDLSWGGSSTWGRWDTTEEEVVTGRRNASLQSVKSRTLDELIDVLENADPWHKMRRRERVPSIEGVVATLAKKSLLPAIWFIFSRKDCESAVKKIFRSGVQLTSDDEQAVISAMVDSLRETQPEAVKEDSVPALLAGAAAHHAGCLPGWKLLIERLYQQGLIKVVFATETLAAGINMPARTTLLTSLSKRRDNGISLLRHNELMQMAGRAGRRGYDSQGHCVIVQSRWDNPDAAWTILKGGPESLESKFATNYGMALNLLRTRTLGEAKEFLNRSFSMYLSGSFTKRRLRDVKRIEKKAQNILTAAGIDSGDTYEGAESSIELFEKLQGRRREEKRAAKLLRQQLTDERGSIAESILSEEGIPRVIGIDLSASSINEGYSLPALLVGRVDEFGSIHKDMLAMSNLRLGDKYLCLGADNNIYIILPPNIAAFGPSDLAAEKVREMNSIVDEVITRASSLSPKSWTNLSKGVLRTEGSSSTSVGIMSCIPAASSLETLFPSAEGLSALEEQKRRIRQVKAEIDALKGNSKIEKQARKRAQAFAKAGSLMDQAASIREEVESHTGGSWRDFQNIVRVLESNGAIKDPRKTQPGSTPSDTLSVDHDGDNTQMKYEFTPLGLVSRELRGSNELWMALALTHPSLQTLSAPQLAAVLSALVAEDAVSRISMIGSAYAPSSQVIETIEQLDEIRRDLSLSQIEAGIDFPTPLDHTLAGVVEAWASGLGWTEVTGDCELDDGDVARLLMRTVDALRQAAFCDHLLPPLRSAARTAARRMNRPPISDLIT